LLYPKVITLSSLRAQADLYGQPGSNELYKGFLKQALNLGIPEIQSSSLSTALQETDVVLDGIFGFSFKGEVRDPFKVVIEALQRHKGPIVSVSPVIQPGLGSSRRAD
jgi:NAD(P)H-hydrate epimerase